VFEHESFSSGLGFLEFILRDVELVELADLPLVM
jgi:hypothetical protein